MAFRLLSFLGLDRRRPVWRSGAGDPVLALTGEGAIVSASAGAQALIGAEGGLAGRALADFATLFGAVSPESMAYLMSAWRGEVNLLDLAKPEYLPFTAESRRTPIVATPERNAVVDQAIEALARIGARKAS